ncbi:hypothetical protein [Gordonia sp. N1V]|uniref:hypothetical protein n=1 Tax=Gordonia sp. N1V TaxID=3034163 RepID=UPI0023E150D3|nr:hypothetical protein [Gordonia sp. N1V]MDF3280904.1 hypothetical protein [Gordonia sp. N1V]
MIYTLTGSQLWVQVDGPQTIAWSANGGAGDEATVPEGMSGHTFALPDGTDTSGLILIASGNQDEQRDECALP